MLNNPPEVVEEVEEVEEEVVVVVECREVEVAEVE